MLPTKWTSLLSLATLAWAGLGCTSAGVSLRADGSPGPEKCSEEALKTMRILRLEPGDSAFVEIDANQMGARPAILTDGPVEGILVEDLKTLPSLTRVYGYVWTSGPTVAVRYYEARPRGGDRIPICAVVRSGPGEMNVLRKKEGSRPGVAVLDHSTAAAWIVDDFR